MTILELLPAIDVTGGQAVRLSSGVIDEGSWGSPIDVARSFDEAGARWVHLVDLDLAFGRGENSELLARVIREVPVRVELSGGITSRGGIEAGLAMGPERVNIATQALDDIDAVCEAVDTFGERVAVCLDVRGDRLAARGGRGEGANVWEALRVLNEAGVARLVVTDVTRDGQMSGSNRDLLASVADQTPARIIASGGVNSLADVEALTGARIAPDDVIDHMLVRWDGTLPPVDAAYRERAAALVERVESLPGLALTGAWVAGTGIAAVVEHARSRAGRLASAGSAEGAGDAKNAGTGRGRERA
mgnify:CR=1 FL=1